MNIRQAVKMAWKSIWGKKGRSALTMLGVIIGIAAVMTIVATMNGYTAKTMEQYSAMGSNKINVQIYSYVYVEDANGNWVSAGKDYFPGPVRLLQEPYEVRSGRDAPGWLQRHCGLRHQEL